MSSDLLAYLSVLVLLVALSSGQSTAGSERCTPQPEACTLNYEQLIGHVTRQFEDMAKDIKTAYSQCDMCGYGQSEETPGESCEKILAVHGEQCGRKCGAERQLLPSGVYWMRNAEGTPTQVWCDMKFHGGGWLQIYNGVKLGLTVDGFRDAIKSHTAVSLVLPNSTSTAIASQKLPLYRYSKVVFGWSSSPEAPIDHYGLHIRDSATGLQEVCFVGASCAYGTTVGSFYIVPTMTTMDVLIPINPEYPHLGLGHLNVQILWGYDRNLPTTYIHWANWVNTKCCLSGNDQAMADADTAGTWRYVILIQ